MKRIYIVLLISVLFTQLKTIAQGSVASIQGDSDKRRSIDVGKHVQGATAFADYLVSAGATFRLE